MRQFGATNARLFGFDASVTVQPAPYFALKAGADYVNAEDTRQNVPLPFTPPRENASCITSASIATTCSTGFTEITFR